MSAATPCGHISPGTRIHRPTRPEMNLLRWLVAMYAVARVGQAFPDRIPIVLIMAAHVIPPLCFALLHGAMAYRLRGIATFVILCFVVGNLSENLSILTGFPFGHYHFTDVMGPKLFQVPILLGLAYIGMGYVSWTLGRLILGNPQARLAGAAALTQPLIAACIMVAWDLSMDPTWSLLVHGWVWHDGGAYFGVPLSNFLGWYVTVYIIYQLFALILSAREVAAPQLPRGFWQLAVIFYAVSAAGNIFVASPAAPYVTDATGVEWSVSAIHIASLLVSIFIMGAFAALAWVRLSRYRAIPCL